MSSPKSPTSVSTLVTVGNGTPSVASSSPAMSTPMIQTTPLSPNSVGNNSLATSPPSSSTLSSPNATSSNNNNNNNISLPTSPITASGAATTTYTTSQLTTIYIEELLGKNINEKDMFIKFKVDGKKFKTKTQKKTINPLWNDKFTISTTSAIDEIIFTIHSQNILGNNVKIGTAKLQIHPTTTTNLRNSVNISQQQSRSVESASVTTTTASISDSPQPTASLNSSSGSSTNGGNGTVLIDSWIIDQWLPVEKKATTFGSSTPTTNNSSPNAQSSSPSSNVELKVRMIVKLRDIMLSDDTSSSKSDEINVTPKLSSRNGANDLSVRDSSNVSNNHQGKEMSIIGKGGSQIRKFTKKITSKMEKTDNSAKKVKDERVAAIEEQLARERQKELEREAIEREKERAREKLRQREEEELQKQMEKERQEERRKAKEAKQKKDKEKKYQPTRPVDYFFVVGCSSKLEPIDQRYETSIKSTDPLEVMYKGELLDCYPPKDDEVLPNHIWMYCFPKGVQLMTEDQAPSFFPFVLTNETGVRFYGSCLMFYEPMPDEMASEVKKRRNSVSSMTLQQVIDSNNISSNNNASGDEEQQTQQPQQQQSQQQQQDGEKDSIVVESSNNKSILTHTTSVHSINSGNIGTSSLLSSTIYVPKCICFISHYPFYSFFRICLNELYQKVFFSTNPQPIERCIYNMVQEVPLPVQGINNVSYTINNLTLLLKRPPDCLLPLTDLPYSMLFKCLDIKNVLILFKCILLEEKIVIISSQYSLLTCISEILSSLLHPFTWPHVYVPILPELLLEYVYSPFPFIMGIHKSYSHNILNEENLMSEIVVADLDNNIVMVPQGQNRQASLPERETTLLTYQLRKVIQYEILASDLPNFNLHTMSPTDQSYTTDHPNGLVTNNNSSNSNTSSTKKMIYHPTYHSVPAQPSQSTINDHIRLSFLQFFCSIMSDYRRHLKYLRVFPKPITLFNKKEFIKSRSNGSSSDMFYTSFIETQSFSYFLDQHNWPKKNLFDYLMETQKYKKPIEELISIYQNSIPQALGAQENNKYMTVHATPLSTIKNSLVTTSIKEYSRFPQLKQDLMVTPATPSHHRTPSSMAQYQQQQLQQMINAPTPLDIYCSSIAHGDASLANTLADDSNTLKAVEEQNKSFVAIIEAFINKLSGETVPEPSDIQQVTELLKFDTGRQILGKLLLKPYKSSPDKPTVDNTQKARLTDAMFHCLGDVLKSSLREANMHSDFLSTRLYLESSFIYHRLQKGTNEHLSELLRNQDIWQNYKFWEQFFFDVIEQRCKSLYGNIVREMLKWSGYPEDIQEKMKLEEREMAFSLLSKQVFYMINLGSQPDLVRRFVNKMCSVINFDIDRTETMMQIVSNITRARDMSDMDDLDSNTQNQTIEGDKHADKELKLYLTKETYLPIGVKSGQAHEGRELLNHLIDEKSNNMVALRSLSRFMNLKSAWTETRSKTSSKIDYRDISENRGDYVVKTFTGHTEGVLCLTLATNHIGHRESNTLITGSADSTLKVWDIVSTRCLGTLEGHGGWVNNLEIGSDSKVISGSYDKTLKLWDLNKCTKIKSFRGHKGSVSCLKNIDTHQFISGSYDHTLCIWDDRQTKPSSILVGHQQPIMCLISDGYKIISGSRDTNIRIWDIRTMSTTKILSGHTDWVKCLQYDADTLLSGSCDGKVKVWSVESGECIRTLQGHSGSINSLLLYHKKEEGHKKFITASADSTIQVWDANYPESYHALSGHSDEVVQVDNFINNIVVSGSYDGTVKLWDVDTGKSYRTIHNHSHRISSLKTHESTILTGSWDKTAKACLFSLDFRN